MSDFLKKMNELENRLAPSEERELKKLRSELKNVQVSTSWSKKPTRRDQLQLLRELKKKRDSR